MIRVERLEQIIRLLSEKQFVSVHEIMQRTGIPKSTLRRDLFELEQQGRLIRTRGGASLSVNNNIEKTSNEPPFRVRQTTNREEKIRIAEAAMQYIPYGDTVILDSGTTTYELACKIKEFSGKLMVATNDLFSAVELSANDELELVVIGGKVRVDNFSMIGYICDRTVNEMHADTAFISADAIDLDHGLMAFSMDEVTSKRSMIKAAREVIVLCDHTKFSTIAFVTISDLSDVDRIITGKELNPKYVSQLRNLGIDVILV